MAGLRHWGRRAGAAFFTVGLMVGTVAALTAAPAGATDPTAPICNNQSPDHTNCQGGDQHGTVTYHRDGDGNLILDVTPFGDFAGWSGVYVCIPYSGMTKSADCTAAQSPLAPGTDYTVSGAAVTYSDKSADFDPCDNTFTITVNAAALANVSATDGWAVHFAPCQGGTDEAFGTVGAPTDTTDTPPPPGNDTTPPTPTNTDTPVAQVVTPSAVPNATPAAQVLGETITKPATAAAPAPAAQVSAEDLSLARTGPNTRPLIELALALLAIGLGLVMLTVKPAPARARV